MPEGELSRSDSPDSSSSNSDSVDMEVFDQITLPTGEETLFSTADDTMIFPDNYPTPSWTTVNNSSTRPDSSDSTTDTVSPHELFRDFTTSAPSSTAFPELSTPGSAFESPFYQSSGLNTSPLEEGALDADLNPADWSANPLFPDAAMESFASNVPIAEPASVETSFASTADSPMVRQKSSPGRPPTYTATPGRKHSDVAGIKAVKSRNKPLPDIVIDQNDDKETAKRKKNTAAARKSRERKLCHTQTLQATITELEEENARLKNILASNGISVEE
ncbi:MAG: hypothetical protein Q9227_007025 [Pyrenula ochraceoflavens]